VHLARLERGAAAASHAPLDKRQRFSADVTTTGNSSLSFGCRRRLNS
jgi:hypothetical protein